MMNRESAFFQRSVKVAGEFLQTAVVIDDRAFEIADESEPIGVLVPPPTPTTAEPRISEPPLTGAPLRRRRKSHRRPSRTASTHDRSSTGLHATGSSAQCSDGSLTIASSLPPTVCPNWQRSPTSW